MEIFVDGGLFELILIVGCAYLLNYIFLKKYIFYLYTALSIGSSVSLLFINHGPLYYCCVSCCIFNTAFLFNHLSAYRTRHPGATLFDINALKRKFLKKPFKRIKPSLNQDQQT